MRRTEAQFLAQDVRNEIAAYLQRKDMHEAAKLCEEAELKKLIKGLCEDHVDDY